MSKAGPRPSFSSHPCCCFPRPHPPTPPATLLSAVHSNELLLLAPPSWARRQSQSIQLSSGPSKARWVPSYLSVSKQGAHMASPAVSTGTARSPARLSSLWAILPSASPPPALLMAAQTTFHMAKSICRATAKTGAGSFNTCEPASPQSCPGVRVWLFPMESQSCLCMFLDGDSTMLLRQ